VYTVFICCIVFMLHRFVTIAASQTSVLITVWYSFQLRFASWCSLCIVPLHDGRNELKHVVGRCTSQV
jgi:hypothetical protein